MVIRSPENYTLSWLWVRILLIHDDYASCTPLAVQPDARERGCIIKTPHAAVTKSTGPCVCRAFLVCQHPSSHHALLSAIQAKKKCCQIRKEDSVDRLKCDKLLETVKWCDNIHDPWICLPTPIKAAFTLCRGTVTSHYRWQLPRQPLQPAPFCCQSHYCAYSGVTSCPWLELLAPVS